MTSENDDDRRTRGLRMHGRVLQTEALAAATPFMEAACDFVFGEVWNRPGLDRRARRLVTLSCVAVYGWSPAIEAYVIGALKSGDMTTSELREFALHFGVYAGWPAGAQVDLAISRAGAPTDDPDRETPSIPATDRRRQGQTTARSVFGHGGLAADCALRGAGELDFVHGEVWSRPGLDRTSRRWISLSCAGLAGAAGPIEDHVQAALGSGDITLSELDEFVLHFAVYAGWPKASVVQAVVDAASQGRAHSSPMGRAGS